jgi:flavin-dependent dehydrogenase
MAMDACDVLIVGGGPGGSSCAWKLQQAGADVVVMDRAVFPRDKVCAGWITPQVVSVLELDLDEYRRHRTLQPITAFRAGLIGRPHDVATSYGRAVSYGIRRCEFDHYLLQRSRARLRLGEAATSIRREGAAWIVNDRIRANMLVGAGGHFCPVARMSNRAASEGPLVAAQEVEFPIESSARLAVEPHMPELYFSGSLDGYGWCFRKGNYLNVGLGLLDRHGCQSATRAFVSFLQSRGRIPAGTSWRWRGHAYLLAEPRARQVLGDGVLLLGDAAGLAYPQSGEGIRPAIESGVLAAATIFEAHGAYSRDRLQPYEARLRARFGLSGPPHRTKPGGALASTLAAGLMRVPFFVRHVVLDRWFLRSADPALV